MADWLRNFALVSEFGWEWMKTFALQHGYSGAFLISLIGAASVIIPIPYTLMIYFLGHFLDPFLLALASGAGSAVGEFSGYVLGYYGRAVISEERKRKVDFWLRIFNRHGALVVFIFAVSPLPDDLLFIPLGIVRYSLVKAFVPCLIGKLIMSFIIALAGRSSIRFIRDMVSEGGWMELVISAVILVAVMVALLKIDWEKIFTKYFERTGATAQGKPQSKE